MHAFELVNDPLHNPTGNDNGLCESGEACVYAPNIGAYQGEGALDFSRRCEFRNGLVSDVTLYSYPANGI